jgi:hypothetical protein
VGHVYLTELRIKNLNEQDSTTPNINEFGNTRYFLCLRGILLRFFPLFGLE